jgi:UDP-glucuronate 4-epimerase
LSVKRILITGTAGFIGFHLAHRLLNEGWQVIGIDNVNDYYSVTLKEDRLQILCDFSKYSFYRCDISDRNALNGVFHEERIDETVPIVHLAAQASVRYGLINPDSYIQSNLIGFFNILEAARHAKCKNFLYASSSSVYGGNTKLPFSVHDNVDHPISLYAATKKSNELLAHVFAYNYALPVTGLRFFTVYGPWGRPDMALFLFTKAILSGKKVSIYNNGDMHRDFTYVDDIVDGIVRLLDKPAKPNPLWKSDQPDSATSWLPYRVYNIGNHRSVHLMEFLKVIENCLGKKADVEFLPMQPGDVKSTYADIEDLTRDTGFFPKTSIQEGIPKFIEWYLEYYKQS